MDVHDFVPEISPIQLPRKISFVPFRSLPHCATASHLSGPLHVEFPCMTASVHVSATAFASPPRPSSLFAALFLGRLDPANAAADFRCNHCLVSPNPPLCVGESVGGASEKSLKKCSWMSIETNPHTYEGDYVQLHNSFFFFLIPLY